MIKKIILLLGIASIVILTACSIQNGLQPLPKKSKVIFIAAVPDHLIVDHVTVSHEQSQQLVIPQFNLNDYIAQVVTPHLNKNKTIQVEAFKLPATAMVKNGALYNNTWGEFDDDKINYLQQVLAAKTFDYLVVITDQNPENEMENYYQGYGLYQKSILMNLRPTMQFNYDIYVFDAHYWLVARLSSNNSVAMQNFPSLTKKMTLNEAQINQMRAALSHVVLTKMVPQLDNIAR